MEITGRLINKYDTESFGSKGFKKRSFVIETDEQYPQKLIFDLLQESCGIIDPMAIGQKLNVMFDVRGREWTSPQGGTKYFNSLVCWKIEVL